MLRTLIAKFTKNLFRPKYTPGYQTKVYPRLGEMIVIHDTLDFGPIATAVELQLIHDIWISDEMPDTGLLDDSWSDEALTFDSLPGISPANGLPVMFAAVAVPGTLLLLSSEVQVADWKLSALVIAEFSSGEAMRSGFLLRHPGGSNYEFRF